MAQGPIGGPRPFVDSDETGPLGMKRPLARTVDDCMESVEAQKFVDNLEESRGETLGKEEKEDLKRAWCQGVIDDTWREKWFKNSRRGFLK